MKKKFLILISVLLTATAVYAIVSLTYTILTWNFNSGGKITVSTTYTSVNSTGIGGLTGSATYTNYSGFAPVYSVAALELVKFSGDNQLGSVNSYVANDITVKMTDDLGNPKQGETINFSIYSEPSGVTGTTISSSTETTDSSGLAKISVKLGDKTGVYIIKADNVLHNKSVFFSLATDQLLLEQEEWNLIIFPVNPGGVKLVDGLFGSLLNFELLRWNPQIEPDVEGYKYERVSEIYNGMSYWMKPMSTNSSFLLTAPGTVNSETVTIQVYPGWNMIGNPFVMPVKWSDCMVKYNSNYYSPEEADTSGILDKTVYWYSNKTYSYGPSISVPDPYLKPWQGNWVYASKSCELIIPFKEFDDTTVPALAPKFVAKKYVPDVNDWMLDFEVSLGDYSDKYNFAGVSGSANDSIDKNDIKKAPVNRKYAVMYFQESESYNRQYTTSFKNKIETYKKWNFRIKTDIYGTEAKLGLGQFNNLPDGYTGVIVDEENKKVIELNKIKQEGYTFLPRNLNSGHRFSLKVAAPGYASLISMTPGVEFIGTYAYPNPALTTMNFKMESGTPIETVEIKIFDISGQSVITLSEVPKDLGSGKYELNNSWNLIDNKGRKIASGIYIYQMKFNLQGGIVEKFVDKFAVVR